MKIRLFILLLLSFFFSCKKETDEKSIFSELQPFDEIEVNSAFDVYISESNTYSVRITGDENVIDNVKYKVENKILKIEDDRSAKWLTPDKNQIKLYITSLPLKKIVAQEACNIRTLNPITSEEFGLILMGKVNEAELELACNTFYYWNNFPCGGRLKLSGQTEVLKIWNCALIYVDAIDVTTNYAEISNGSQGDCFVTVLKRLEYDIYGTGNVHLYGSPDEIICNGITSSGQLIEH